MEDLTGIGTGVMVIANLPIIWLFGYQAMRAYHEYIRRLRAGEFAEHRYPPITDVVPEIASYLPLQQFVGSALPADTPPETLANQ